MERKIHLFLSVIFFAISVIATFAFAGFGWIGFLSSLGFSLLFLWSAKNLQNVLYFITIILPFAIKFNYFKINLAFITGLLGFSEIAINLSMGLYLFIGCLFVIRFLTKPKFFLGVPLFFPLIVVGGYFFSSIFWSDYPMVSLVWFTYLIAPFCFYFMYFSVIEDERDLKNLAYCLCVSLVLPAIESLNQILSGSLFYVADSSLGRVMGTFTHPNNFGSYLSVVLIAILIFIFSSIKIKRNDFIVLKIGVFFSTLLLFASFSRTAWVSVFIFIFLFYLRKWKVALAIIIISLGALSTLMLFEPTQERVMGIFQRNPFDPISARQEIARVAVKKFIEKPYFGHGIGTFEEVIRSEKETFESSSFPHNDMLLFLVEGGIFGGLLYVLYFCGAIFLAGKVFLQSFSSHKKNIHFDVKNFSKGIFLMLLTFFIAGVAEAITSKSIDQVIIWSVLGGWFAFMLKNAEKSKKPNADTSASIY